MFSAVPAHYGKIWLPVFANKPSENSASSPFCGSPEMSRAPAATHPHWHDFIPAVVLMIVSTIGVFAGTLWPSGDRGQYAVVAPPSYTLGQTIELVRAAGGGIVAVGGLRNVVIVHSPAKNFVAALYGAGAWLVIDPQRLRGCIGFSPDSTSRGARS